MNGLPKNALRSASLDDSLFGARHLAVKRRRSETFHLQRSGEPQGAHQSHLPPKCNVRRRSGASSCFCRRYVVQRVANATIGRDGGIAIVGLTSFIMIDIFCRGPPFDGVVCFRLFIAPQIFGLRILSTLHVADDSIFEGTIDFDNNLVIRNRVACIRQRSLTRARQASVNGRESTFALAPACIVRIPLGQPKVLYGENRFLDLAMIAGTDNRGFAHKIGDDERRSVCSVGSHFHGWRMQDCPVGTKLLQFCLGRTHENITCEWAARSVITRTPRRDASVRPDRRRSRTDRPIRSVGR